MKQTSTKISAVFRITTFPTFMYQKTPDNTSVPTKNGGNLRKSWTTSIHPGRKTNGRLIFLHHMRTIFLWILWATASPCLAQWHDNVWLFGYDSNGAPNLPGVDRIRFEFKDSFSIRQYPGNVYLWDTSSALSDSSGNLIP